MGICCSAWLTVDMYGLGQAMVAQWLHSRPQCDKAVATWRWPSLWILHSAQFACQVLQATWSIKHLNDDHSFMYSHSRPFSIIPLYIFTARCIQVYLYVFSIPPSLYKGVLLVSERRIWLDLASWWNKSPVGFKGGYFEQPILQRAFTPSKSTNAPMFQNTAFRASYFIPYPALWCKSDRTSWRWQQALGSTPTNTSTSVDPPYACTCYE